MPLGKPVVALALSCVARNKKAGETQWSLEELGRSAISGSRSFALGCAPPLHGAEDQRRSEGRNFESEKCAKCASAAENWPVDWFLLVSAPVAS
jgi:hypothetical protein